MEAKMDCRYLLSQVKCQKLELMRETVLCDEMWAAAFLKEKLGSRCEVGTEQRLSQSSVPVLSRAANFLIFWNTVSHLTSPSLNCKFLLCIHGIHSDIFYYNILEEPRIICFLSVSLSTQNFYVSPRHLLTAFYVSRYHTSCLSLQSESGKNLRIWTAVLTQRPQSHSRSPVFTVSPHTQMYLCCLTWPSLYCVRQLP